MNKDGIDKFLAITMSIGASYGTSYTDDFCFFNDKLLGYSVGLVCEIDDLLEEGYTKDEIHSFIMESDFALNNPELTSEECGYLKNRALELLEIRWELFTEKEAKKRILDSTQFKN